VERKSFLLFLTSWEEGATFELQLPLALHFSFMPVFDSSFVCPPKIQGSNSQEVQLVLLSLTS
jgi:hypothetical protein